MGQHGRSIFEQWHSDENMNLRFFIRLNLPLAVMRVSNSPELKSFLLYMCSRLRVVVLLAFRRGCQHYPSFGRRAERIFCVRFEFLDILCQFPSVSAGAPLPFWGFRLAFFSRILEPMESAPEVRTFE